MRYDKDTRGELRIVSTWHVGNPPRLCGSVTDPNSDDDFICEWNLFGKCVLTSPRVDKADLSAFDLIDMDG